MLSVLPDAVVTNAETPVTVSVLTNDTGANLTITSFSNPAHGSLVFNGDASFTYTPSAGFVGDDSFAYTVRDAQGTPASAEVTISVVPNAGTTVATDDVVQIVAGGSVIVPVLANDLAADGGALEIIAISMPGHGVVNVLPDQTIRYVPQSGFTGIDSFTYTVTDGQGSSASATVTVKVLAKNSPPVAAADTFSVEAGQPTVLAVLANDSDPDGGPLQIVGFTMPSHGSLVFNPDRTFTYTPAAGFLGQDQFTYTIRDNRSDSAVAAVTLVVAEVIESPIAFGEQVTTEAGLPVTIDVLANDTLPVGQEVAIVAVTLPYRGKLAFNPDKTITYTPNAGFVGIDDFTYTISNGKTGTSKATVTVEVRLPTVENVYANGYARRRRIVLPAQGIGASAADNVVLQFTEQGAWLKSIDQGGKVASAEGFDLRFELADGNKLDHEIETYDPVAGRLLAWVRLPSWALSSQLQLLLYYGNPAAVVTEANPAGVWQGYLARWRLPAGGDATGNGRDLVAVGVAADSLLGNAARFDGTGNLMIADTDWLTDLSAVTVQALVKPDASMLGSTNGILVQGSPDSTLSTNGVTLSYIALTSTGVPNVVHAKVNCSDGNAFVLSSANQQKAERQLIHGTWLAGNAPDLYLDGVKSTPSRSAARSGRTSITGPLYIGAGWQGLIDEVRLAGRALPADWITLEARNMLTPELSYGLGHEETIDTVDLPPIAVPFAVATTSDKFVDIDVLSQALDPDGAGDLSLTDVSQPAHGMATVVNNLVRYTPNADFVGTDQFTYTINDGARSASSLISVAVAAAAVSAPSTPPSPSTPQNDSGVVLPSAQRTVTVANQSQLDSALAAAVAGDHIVLANGSYSGPGNWTKSGTQASPIVVRAANLLGARITGSFNPNGSDLILHGLDFQAAAVNVGNSVQSNRVKLWRCRWRDMAPSITIALRTYKCADLDVAYCEWVNWGGRGIAFGPAAGTRRPRVRRCLFRDTPVSYENSREAIQAGFGFADRPVDLEAVIEFCRFVNWNTDDETVSIKSSSNILRQLSFENNHGRLGNRLGLNNLYEAVTFKGSTGIRIHDKGNRILGCDVTQASQGLRITTGNHDADTVLNTSSTPSHPNAINAHVAGCAGTLTIAHAFSGQTIQARNTRVRQHSGSVTLVSGTHTGTDSQPNVTETLYSWASRIWLTNAEVGPNAELG